MAFSKKNLQAIIDTPFKNTFEPDHQLGPDYLIPSNTFRTWKPEAATQIKVAKTGPRSSQPFSLLTLLENTVKKCPDSKALSVKRNGEWISWTYSQYWKDIQTVAKAFMKLGLQRYHAVAMLGFNAPEWFMSYFGAISAGGIAVGIYLTNAPSACLYVLNHSRANIVVVEGEHQLKKILEIRKQLPHLKAIIQYGEPVNHREVFSWDDILKIGESVPDNILYKSVKSLAINQCCSIIYTSGTTGTPKAVMLNHDNYIYLYWSLLERDMFFAPHHENASLVSYLPLNHIAEQAVAICCSTMLRAHVWFAQPDALKGSLVTTLQEAKPTTFIGVPRVYEKIKENMDEKLANLNWIVKSVIDWAMNCVRSYIKSCLNKNPYKPYGYKLANLIVYRLREKVGLQNAMYFAAGGAPMSTETFDFFMGLGVIVNEFYGMSETAGGHVMNSSDSYRINSVGRKTDFNELKIDSPSPGEEGEVLMKGRNCFMGYMFDEEKTKETIDDEGWVHSGDIGRLDDEDCLYITGRIKELVITAGGENIAPYPIEDAVKAELPIISQAVVVGDRKKYLSILLTLKAGVDPATQAPLDTLQDVSIKWCRSIGSNAKTVDDILHGSDSKVNAAIQKGIDRANLKATSNACRVQKWRILPRDLTLQNDEIGPTLKLKRHVVLKRYSAIIDSMYD